MRQIGRTVRLIGGSSGVGKTSIAKEIARLDEEAPSSLRNATTYTSRLFANLEAPIL